MSSFVEREQANAASDAAVGRASWLAGPRDLSRRPQVAENSSRFLTRRADAVGRVDSPGGAAPARTRAPGSRSRRPRRVDGAVLHHESSWQPTPRRCCGRPVRAKSPQDGRPRGAFGEAPVGHACASVAAARFAVGGAPAHCERDLDERARPRACPCCAAILVAQASCTRAHAALAADAQVGVGVGKGRGCRRHRLARFARRLVGRLEHPVLAADLQLAEPFLIA